MTETSADTQYIFDFPATYRIAVEGTLANEWSDRLGGMVISHATNKNGRVTTTLVGELADQAALAGVLRFLFDWHLPLIEVERLMPDQLSLTEIPVEPTD